MSKLLEFLYRIRYSLSFVLLEICCLWFIVIGNSYPRIAFLNSSNRIAGNFYAFRGELISYFNLKTENQRLAEENATLVLELEALQGRIYSGPRNLSIADDTILNRTITAKVVNNSVTRNNNFFTLNKGHEAGIKKGMGVILPDAALGIISHTSPHFSTAVSLLNSRLMVSVKLSSSGSLGILRWKGPNPNVIDLLYVPRHIEVQVGDSVYTSGFNASFPAGLLLGTVSTAELRSEDSFHQLEVTLFKDFSSIDHVFVYENMLKIEKDSLEKQLGIEYE